VICAKGCNGGVKRSVLPRGRMTILAGLAAILLLWDARAALGDGVASPDAAIGRPSFRETAITIHKYDNWPWGACLSVTESSFLIPRSQHTAHFSLARRRGVERKMN